jgi:hypothetical protein
MVALKIPLAALIYIVWWAIKQEPEEQTPSNDDDGGIKRNRRHPRQPFPRHPRRGPHADAPPQPPARVRSVRAKARTVGH